MILKLVLRRFGSRGEARRWPFALGWVSEDDQCTKLLHWGSEPWCGVPLVDFLACVCPAMKEAPFCVRLHVRIGVPRFQVPQGPALGQAKLKNTRKEGFSLYFVFPLSVFETVRRHIDFRIYYFIIIINTLLNNCPL